jgi:hypothetical protein
MFVERLSEKMMRMQVIFVNRRQLIRKLSGGMQDAIAPTTESSNMTITKYQMRLTIQPRDQY